MELDTPFVHISIKDKILVGIYKKNLRINLEIAKEINLRLSEYSLGKFDKRLTLSSRLDDIDAIISGINMLGEELKAITISRNYFTNIFNSVSDMVFVLNAKGVIEDANKPAEEQLNYEPGSLRGK